jgi:hypothetical protein
MGSSTTFFGFVLDYGRAGPAILDGCGGVVYDGARLGQPTSSALAHD